MTAPAMDVRELSVGEIDLVTGGCVRCAIEAAKFIGKAIAAGLTYDAAKALWDNMQMEGHDSPRPVSYGV